MKLEKIYDKVKKYLLLIEEDKEPKKKKIKELEEKISNKIDKLKNKLKNSENIEEKNRLLEEIDILKKFRKQLKIKDKK